MNKWFSDNSPYLTTFNELGELAQKHLDAAKACMGDGVEFNRHMRIVDKCLDARDYILEQLTRKT